MTLYECCWCDMIPQIINNIIRNAFTVNFLYCSLRRIATEVKNTFNDSLFQVILITVWHTNSSTDEWKLLRKKSKIINWFVITIKKNVLNRVMTTAPFRF